jgi:hypothetical protein
MADKPREVWSLVLVPAVVTLVVSVVRLVGELRGWSPTLFNSAGPSPDGGQGLFGITLLVPFIGFWFGWRLRRDTGGPGNLGRAALVYLLSAAVFAGGFLLVTQLGWLVLPSKEAPGVPQGIPYMAGCLGLALLVMFVAWPRLSWTLLVYALLARLPVVAITFIAVGKGWGSHYEKLPPDFVLPPDVDKALFLSMPQVTFWPVFTVLVGGLCGCLAAALRKKN